MASSASYLSPSDITISPTNTESTIIPKLSGLEKQGKVLQIVYSLSSTTVPSSLTATSFNIPSYIKYTNTIEYNTFSHPVTLTNAYALKILAYITISTDRIYTISTNATSDKIKLYLNNFLTLDNISSSMSSVDIYLNVGIYLLYIEKIAAPTDQSLTLKLTPKGTPEVSIDTYINTNFTLIANATSSRDTAITTYCSKSANLFSTDTTNICNTNLNSAPLLSNVLLNSCFPASTGILKNTTGTNINKLDDNCKATYNRSTLNSTIKNDFNTKYQSWANKVVTDNVITSNKDALEEYLDTRNPTETDFPFGTNISVYCENDPEVRKNYNVITQTGNKFCKTVYGKTYTGTNKTTVDNSIQQIKNNFCDPTQTTANITTNDCSYEYKNKNNLKTAISSYCFPTTATGRTLNKNSNNAKFHSNCQTIYQLPNLNSDIKTELDTQYQNWATGVTTNTNTKFPDHDAALTEYIVTKNPTQQQIFGTTPTVTDTLINYCETQISPNNNKYVADNNNNNLCNTLYNNATLNTHVKIKASIDKMKTNYCTTNGTDGKLRYETDANCKNDFTGLLSNTLTNRCVPNNTFNYNDNWCVTTSNNNINETMVPFSTMRTARNTALKNQVSSIEVKDYLNKKILNNDNYTYATTTYNTISDPANKKLSDELLTKQLFQYCENKEPNYPTDPNSQCKGIYDVYKTNVAVKTSRDIMRDTLCKNDANITTDIDDTNTNNTYKCKTTVFDTTNNLDKFAPTVNAYCTKNDNIATSTECKNYYTNIENKILTALNLKINSAPISSFSNKYYQTKSDMVEDYDKKIELSTFQNDQPADATPKPEDNSQETPADNAPYIFYINTPQSCPQIEDEMETHDDSSWLSLLLFFIFILLIVSLFSSCMYYKKTSSNSNVVNNPSNKK